MDLDYDAIRKAAFIERILQDKVALLEPGKILTRKMLAAKMKPRRWKERDFDDEIQGGSSVDRTAVAPAFDR